ADVCPSRSPHRSVCSPTRRATKCASAPGRTAATAASWTTPLRDSLASSAGNVEDSSVALAGVSQPTGAGFVERQQLDRRVLGRTSVFSVGDVRAAVSRQHALDKTPVHLTDDLRQFDGQIEQRAGAKRHTVVISGGVESESLHHRHHAVPDQTVVTISQAPSPLPADLACLTGWVRRALGQMRGESPGKAAVFTSGG